MTEPGKTTDALDYAAPVRKKRGIRYYVGLVLMNFGIVTATMFTVKYLKQEPSEPLGFDLTLQWGYGGFIAYGVAAATLGLLLMFGGRKG